jgi:hypothetical protein
MKRILITAAAAAAVLAGSAAVAAPAMASTSAIPIHEIYYNSPGPDTGSNSSLNHEWVQLHNTSASRINLTGWTLRDKQGHIYTFGTYTIKAHGYVKIHTGSGTNTQTDRYWRQHWYVWNNTGDQATIKNRTGTVIDQRSYTGTSLGYKIYSA